MAYTNTNYATLSRYLCSVVHRVKNMFSAPCAQIWDGNNVGLNEID
jgi:hypothetical protein